MAIQDLTQLGNALSQRYDKDLAYQWNRQTEALRIIQISKGQGKNVAWDAQFPTAATPAGAFAPGSDVGSGEYTYDPEVPASLPWANYRAPTKVEGLAVDAAMSSLGSADDILNLFDTKVKGAITRLTALINSDFFVGDGSDGSGNQTLVGLLGGALETSGTYATIDRSTYTAWAGNVLGNGGIQRPLTDDLLRQLRQNIKVRSGREPNYIICSYGVARKYAGLFAAVQRVVTDGKMPSAYEMGTMDLRWGNMKVVEDKDCPAGTLIMGDRETLELKYLPRNIPGLFANQGQDVTATGGNGSTAQPVPLQCRVEVMPKTGDAYPVNVYVRVQAQVTHPNANGYIADISES